MKETSKDDPKISDIEKIIKEYELHRLHITFAERMAVLVVAGFGLLATLAWDSALKEIFVSFSGGIVTPGQKILYALILTLIATAISILLGRFLKKSRSK